MGLDHQVERGIEHLTLLIALSCTVLQSGKLAAAANSLGPTVRRLSGCYQDWWPCSVLIGNLLPNTRIEGSSPLCLTSVLIKMLLKSRFCNVGLDSVI